MRGKQNFGEGKNLSSPQLACVNMALAWVSSLEMLVKVTIAMVVVGDCSLLCRQKIEEKKMKGKRKKHSEQMPTSALYLN